MVEKGSRPDMSSGVVLPPPLWKTKRESLAPQQTFSNQVTMIVPTAIRGEFARGHLANFLRQHNKQTGLGQEKIGIVFLINDHRADRYAAKHKHYAAKHENKHIVEENRLTQQYLTLLSQGNLAGIQKLGVSEEYLTVAKELVERDLLEIRVDYTHEKAPKLKWRKKKRTDLENWLSTFTPNHGKLRMQNLEDVAAFVNPDIPTSAMTIHFQDVDITLPNNHYQNLQQSTYDNLDLRANLASYDLIPGMHESENEETEIGKNALIYFDEFRLFHFGKYASEFLNQHIRNGIPTISGRFSTFFYEGHDHAVRSNFQELDVERRDEDYYIAEKIINHNAHEGSTSRRGVGNAGEAYFLNRIRTPLRSRTTYENAEDDATGLYPVIQKKDFHIEPYFGENYDLLLETDANKFIERLESIYGARNRNPEFRDSMEYQAILTDENEKERRKVHMRKRLLLKHLRSLQGVRSLEPLEERMLAPYERYFPDEFTAMQERIDQGETPQDIAKSYFTREDSEFRNLFDTQTPVHQQIVRLRTLMQYAFNYGRLYGVFRKSTRARKLVNALSGYENEEPSL